MKMNNNVSQKISIKEMKEAISKSGYLIEQRVEPIIEKHGFYTEANVAFKDEETGKSREIDIKALSGIKIYRKGFHLIFPVLLCECENNSQPVVFFKREMTSWATSYDDVKCSGMPVKFLTKDGFVILPEYMNFDKFHHYFKGPIATQYCSFLLRKDKKAWIAKHSEEQHNTFLSLIKAINFEIDEHCKIWRPPEKDEEEYIEIEMYYPVLILEGKLYEARIENDKLILKQINHIQYRKQYISLRGEKTYQIDVITEKFLPKYLEILDKEIETIKKKFVTKRKVVEISINALVEEAKKRIKQKKSYKDISVY